MDKKDMSQLFPNMLYEWRWSILFYSTIFLPYSRARKLVELKSEIYDETLKDTDLFYTESA